MSVAVSDLVQLAKEEWLGPVPFLYCYICNTRASANLGDYFDRPASFVFSCCEQDMSIVTEVLHFVPWSK